MTGAFFGVMSLAVSVALTRTLAHAPPWSGTLAHANARSLHAGSVPRTGGLGVVAALGCLGFFADGLELIVAIALGLAFVSLVDDILGVAIPVRLAAHLSAGMTFAASAVWAQGLVACAITALGVAWAANLFNFMDGMDGFAGGMTVAGFGTYAAVAWVGGATDLALLCLVLVGGAAGFLVFNFPPARIFLGDVGSIPVGFLTAAVGVAGWMNGAWPLWLPPVLFGPFLVDATVTLVRRLARRERVWEAHCEHYYQRLVRMGWSHRRVLLCEYALMGASVLVAVSAAGAREPVAMLLVATLATAYAALMILVDRRWRRFDRRHTPEPLGSHLETTVLAGGASPVGTRLEWRRQPPASAPRRVRGGTSAT